jgi:hypothetical protein
MKKIFTIFIFFYISLILFLPRENIYFTLEKQLQKMTISLSNETIENKFYYTKISDASIIWEDTEIGLIESISLKPWIFYNSFEIENIIFNGDVREFLPKKIEKIYLKQSIFSPKTLFIDAKGDFGKINGFLDEEENKLHLELVLSDEGNLKYRPFLTKFKYSNNLWIYDEILK